MLYVACAVLYIAIGTWRFDFLLSFWVACAYLLITAWLVPAGVRWLLVSWAAHDLEPYAFQRHMRLKVAFVPLLIGSYAPDMMTKWFVYGIHIGAVGSEGDRTRRSSTAAGRASASRTRCSTAS